MQPPSAHKLIGTCRQSVQTKITYQFNNPAPVLHRLRLEGNYGTLYDLKLASEEGLADARFLVSRAYFQALALPAHLSSADFFPEMHSL